jgi:Protein of unknown function (DUF4231)
MGDAQTWIGASAADDSLDLAKISASVSSEAVALHKILNSSKVTGLMRIRRGASAAAAEAQKTFKRLSLAAIFGAAIAALASGLLLYGAGSDTAAPAAAVAQAVPPPAAAPAAGGSTAVGLVRWANDHRTAIMLIQIVGLLASTVAASVLAGLKLVEQWSDNRNKSETLRREVFNEVLNQANRLVPAPLAAEDAGNPVAQALEFFRRYQHELQITYYAKGVARHEAWAGRLTWLTAALAGLAAVTGIVAALGGSGIIVSAFLGIAVPILLSAAQSWRATSRDSDKVDAYMKAHEALDAIFLNVDDVRAQAALGDVPAVRAYIDSVHIVMTTEGGAWAPAGKS